MPYNITPDLFLFSLQLPTSSELNFNGQQPIANSPKRLKPFYFPLQLTITVDASHYSLGALLKQNDHPVSCISHRLSTGSFGSVLWVVKRQH